MTATDPTLLPALARAVLERSALERADDTLIDRLRKDPATRVVPVHGDRAAVAADGPARLQHVAPAEITGTARWAFLGRDERGTALLTASTAPSEPAPCHAAAWGSLRAIGGELSALESGILVEAVALGGWLARAPFCPACGARTQVRAAGWARRCPRCGSEHFPRADPAVIVAIESDDRGRLLLGMNAQWAHRRMFSAFAGFVEAGESLEAAIAREIAEEAGVILSDVRYRSSQAWPYPHSLMLGFHARAVADADPRADGEEILEVRWFTRGELRAALRGEAEITLPGPASIAHRLIVDWVGSS